MRDTRSEEVYLDLRHLEPGFVKKRFPRIYETCLSYGLRADSDLLPIHPAAHYMMGGVRSDTDGRTSLAGLLACGEVACAGVHGANRLASNSLLEGVVFGKRAGDSARELLSRSSSAPDALVRGFMKELNSVAGLSAGEISAAREKVQKTMWEHVGIIRSPEGLEVSRRELKTLDRLARVVSADPYALETRNIFYTAVAIRYAAMRRTESRGAHYRADFPSQDDEHWLVHKALSAEMGLSELLL
jgi:L-aspartate oxidase